MSQRKKHNPERFHNEFETRQRATVWPDTLRAGRTVDEFLWKGDPDATLLQRLGISVFATMLSLFDIMLWHVIFTQKDMGFGGHEIGSVIGLLLTYVCARLLRNIFLRRVATSETRRSPRLHRGQ